jgi:hypothetical protein
MGSFKARKTRALKLPITPGRSRSTLNFTSAGGREWLPSVDRSARVIVRKARKIPGTVAFFVPGIFLPFLANSTG